VTATPPSSLASFRGLYPFPLDPFQEQACRSLDLGNDVLVAAPTGAGKTVVGEYAVHRAVQTGRKCFYTTPIKALSNQKYADLRERYGEVDVGLLTGDVSVNGEAPVVVMTTEVLRNMLYAGSATLQGLGYVVMDEVHYLADKERGPVWEEVIITLPPSVSLVSLSATVSNAEEFGEWLGTVRGPTDVVVEEHRPVPLWQHVMVGRRLHDLFIDEQQQRVNPELVRLARESARLGKTGDRRPERGGRRPRVGPAHLIPSRADVVDRLERADLLPVIVFIFSRAGCDAAAEQALRSGLRLTDTAEAAEIDRVVERRSSGLAAEDRAVLGFEQWRATLLRGVAAHHAGLLPIFKQVVEELFARGLVKVVYATETLALGINMPARSVVLERLVKWNGEQHVDVTPGEYTQLTGRAGRRGIDVEGHGVVLWHQGLDPVALGGLASTRTYPLRSSFRPSYNMAVNLVHQVGRDRARRILESSFAQFQTDRATVGLASRRRRLAEAMAGYADAMTCDRGDFGEYATLRRELSDVEAAAARERRRYRQEETAAVVTALRVGDILDIPSGRSRGLAVVLQPAEGNGRDLAPPVVLSESRQVRRLSVAELRRPPAVVGTVRVPRSFNAKVPAARRSLVAQMRAAAHRPEPDTAVVPSPPTRGGTDEQVQRLQETLRAHPCHGCPDRDEHARWAERRWALQREYDRIERSVERRSTSIANAFDRVCQVLDALGYLDGDTVTADGARLRGLFGELDLLAAESLRQGLWDGLGPAELAACASALTYQARGAEPVAAPHVPPGPVRAALEQMQEVWEDLHDLEGRYRLSYLRPPDPGFAHAAYRWAAGQGLAAVLVEVDLTPGDFVRAARQVLDVLDQVAAAAGSGPVHTAARAGADAMNRGVVCYESRSAS
jgi:ATP-dependent RNA helicase HelY